MAKLLFTTLPSNDLGLLTRSLPIAEELSRAGHEILFCSPAKAPSRLIAEAGFANLVPKHPIYDLMATGGSLRSCLCYIASGRWKPRYGSFLRFMGELIPALPYKSAPRSPEIWDIGQVGAQMGMLNEGLVRASCDAFMELIAECGADIVVDFWNPFASIAARALKKPIVSVIQSDAHPGSRGFIWWKKPPSSIPTPVPVINKVIAKYGLPAIGKIEELSVGDLTLVVGMPETDPLPEGADVTYIGPVLWQREAAELPDWIGGLGEDKPLIWVYSGNPSYTSGHDALSSIVVIQACVAALRDEDVQVVLTTGYHDLPKALPPLPANFRFEPYLPGLAMAEKCDLLIHHGGYGSCQTGLYSGRPAVIIPTFSERESNARRVAAAGAGLVMPVANASGEKRVDAEELRAAVRRVLADPSFAEKARLFGEKMRAFGGPRRASSLIESFIKTRMVDPASAPV